MGIDPLKMNKLEVVANKYIKGEFIYPGIVNSTTYHGDMESLKLDSKAVILDYEGLQLKRNFYSPVYKTEQQAGSRLPDFRNLLYWKPDVQTDASGNATVEFYNSDIKGKYVAVLQVMDDAGYAGSYYFTFDVTNKYRVRIGTLKAQESPTYNIHLKALHNRTMKTTCGQKHSGICSLID